MTDLEKISGVSKGKALRYGKPFIDLIAEYVEENEGIKGDPSINHGIMGSDLLRCDNSSNIMLYHGIKDESVLNKVITHMREKELYLI
jgi:hypothetical protein